MPTIDRRIPLLLALLGLMAMFAATGWQSYTFWQKEKKSEAAQSDQPLADEKRPLDNTPNINLRDANLFGSFAPDSTTTQEPDTQDLPETNLRLTLRGVLAASGEFPGSALVEDSQGNTEAYLVGDTLPGNARLRTVLSTRVIIERNGALENLFFPQADERNGLVLETGDPAEPTLAQPTTNGTSSQARPPSDEQARREEIRERLQQLRQRLQDSR